MLLRVVLGKWLQKSHCPTAKTRLARCVTNVPSPIPTDDDDHSDKRKGSRLRVLVETFAGARVAVVGSSRDVRVSEFHYLIEAQNPAFPATAQGLFAAGSEGGHLSKDLTLGDLVAQQQQRTKEPKAEVGTAGGGSGGGGGGGSGGDGGGGGETRIALVVALHLQKWSTAKSNKTLEFSKGDRAIKRPGNLSSYPCGRTENLLRRCGDGFHVRIAELPPVCNALTIGILSSRRGHGEVMHPFPNESCEGVGSDRHSMGVSITNVFDRLVTRAGKKKKCIRVAGHYIGPPFEMFKRGDCLRFTVVREESSHGPRLMLEITLNGLELFTAPIPESFVLPFQPLCTLPNDCVLELVS